MKILTCCKPWILLVLLALVEILVATRTQGAVLSFEPGDANQHFVFDQMGPYEPNPYDSPDDGADHLAQQTSSAWVGMKSGETSSASLFWDGGLDGGNNSLLNLLLPDTFDLNSFIIAGVYGSQTVTLQGLNNGQVLYSGNLGIDLTPQLFQADWAGIDQFQILYGGDFVVDPQHASAAAFHNWAIDNVIYNESLTPVPLPNSALILALGGLLLTVSGWRMPLLVIGVARRSRRG
ncbi:MAG: hypothetical protein HZB57_01325 [Gammaproteobacteria bacterium]|nr:hypothetical protein [Gammaproteobacteria bacterium]